jgi:hypothetical protein
MKFNKVFFYLKKLFRDLFNPLIYKTNIDKTSILGEYYFVFSEEELLAGGSQNFHFDENGIPIIPTYIDIEEKSFHYYPISIGQYALAIFHTYLKSNDSKDKERFLIIADWFVDNQDDQGYWTAQVQEKKYNLEIGWVSSMAQGRVLSVLLRAYQITNNKKYYKSALQGLETFSDTSKFLNYYKNNIFYEEYPSKPGSFVLNGMIFALWGLYDFIRLDGNANARKYFDEGISSLKNMISQYDIGDWSCYDLRQETWNKKYLNPCTVHYQYIHINQLYVLYHLTEENIFLDYSYKWKKYDNLLNRIKMYVKKYAVIKNR